MIEVGHGRGSLGDRHTAGRLEWRIANGIGGFAAGSASGELTHRRQGLLFAALTPDATPTLLLVKLSEILELDDRAVPLDTSAWGSGIVEPRGHLHLESFSLDGSVPLWVWSVAGVRLEKRVWMERADHTTHVQYRLGSTTGKARLSLLVLVNHRAVDVLSGDPGSPPRVEPATGGLRIEALEGAAPLWLLAPGAEIQPLHDWHRDFALRLEGATEPSHEHHLAAARLTFTLQPGEAATLVASTRPDAGLGESGPLTLVAALARRRAHDRGLVDAWRRAQPAASRHAPDWVRTMVMSADSLLADPVGPSRAEFGLFAESCSTGDWGRDTAAALPGLALATGRPERAREVLERMLGTIQQGLLPRGLPSEADRQPPGGVDAPLWLVQAVRAYFEHTIDAEFLAHAYPRLEAMLEAVCAGAAGGISLDRGDGLLRAGVDDVHVTWMDPFLARAGLPPRHGKAVEVNALWYNALTAMMGFARRLRKPADRWEGRAARAEQSFARFWNAERQCLVDVLDGPNGMDASMRPNQVLALSLPDSPLAAPRRRAVLASIDRELATSHGLRSLTPSDPRYIGSEASETGEVASAAVLGSAWTWLLAHHAVAHFRVTGDHPRALGWLEPAGSLMADCGLGLLPERADGDPPHAPRGRIDRAWPIAAVLWGYHEIAGERRDLRRRESARAERETEPVSAGRPAESV